MKQCCLKSTAIALILAWSLQIASVYSEKCGVLEFDPSYLKVNHLGNSETYLYTELPKSRCSDIVLNFVNFCFDLVESGSERVNETVSELTILGKTPFPDFEILAFVPFVTDTSSCEGSEVESESLSLCCISRLLSDFLNFNITVTRGVLDYNFALRAPDRVDRFVPVGYTDYRIQGFRLTENPRANGVNSHIGIGQTQVIPLTLVSFTEKKPASYNELCPCTTETTTNETIAETTTNETIETTAEMTTNETIAETTSPSPQDIYISAIALLTAVSITFISISVFLAILILRLSYKRKWKGKYGEQAATSPQCHLSESEPARPNQNGRNTTKSTSQTRTTCTTASSTNGRSKNLSSAPIKSNTGYSLFQRNQVRQSILPEYLENYDRLMGKNRISGRPKGRDSNAYEEIHLPNGTHPNAQLNKSASMRSNPMYGLGVNPPTGIHLEPPQLNMSASLASNPMYGVTLSNTE